MSMTLQEMLDLLPDNDTGEISAADMRAIVTGLYDNSAANRDAIDSLAGSGGSVSGRWQVNPQAGEPGGMQVTPKDGTWQSTSALRFAKVDQHSADLTNALLLADAIYGQKAADADVWCRWDVSGGPIEQASYVEIPVTYVASNGFEADAAWQAGVFILVGGET